MLVYLPILHFWTTFHQNCLTPNTYESKSEKYVANQSILKNAIEVYFLEKVHYFHVTFVSPGTFLGSLILSLKVCALAGDTGKSVSEKGAKTEWHQIAQSMGTQFISLHISVTKSLEEVQSSFFSPCRTALLISLTPWLNSALPIPFLGPAPLKQGRNKSSIHILLWSWRWSWFYSEQAIRSRTSEPRLAIWKGSLPPKEEFTKAIP